MAAGDIMYRYALLDESKKTVYIDDIERAFALGHRFYCPHCHKEMYATFGPDYAPHFRHKGAKCQQEKYLHSLAEHVFYEEYAKCLDSGQPFNLVLRIPVPCNNACVLKQHINCREHYINKKVDLTQEYSLLSLEQRVDVDDHYRIPDILLESIDGKQLWIEFWVSHETEEEKRREGRIIEIKLETEKDLEKNRRHEIIQSAEDDLAVRLFNIKADDAESLFSEAVDEDLPIGYPCEKYFYYEVSSGQDRYGVVDPPKKDIEPGVIYQILMRLNWRSSYDSSEGEIGCQTTERGLAAVCRQRYYSSFGSTFFLDHAYDSLIISEWRKEQPLPRQSHTSASLRSPLKTNESQPASIPPGSLFDSSSVEWVDLGLPSGTIWAKNDVAGLLTFRMANETYGGYVPSEEDAVELRLHCERKWDSKAGSLILIGPNGNFITFTCKEGHKSYWLNTLDRIDRAFGHCFRVIPPLQIMINDADLYDDLYVRLVKH